MNSSDAEFLEWLADRLVHVYGEDKNVDYVLSLRRMANEARRPNQSKVVEIDYTNYAGVDGTRKIIPKHLWFGHCQWHPQPQWLLEAEDLGKKEVRTFAVKKIYGWRPVSDQSFWEMFPKGG